MQQMERPLFCIVADRNHAALAEPDMNTYTPKGLADKEKVKPKTVYNWIRDGLPALRQGKRGPFKIHYQDYVNWMIECARDPDTNVNPPAWAYWCIRAKI